MKGIKNKITEGAEDFVKNIKLKANNISGIKDTFPAIVTGSTLKVTGSGLIVFGADALKMFTKLYADIHSSDDTLMQHSFSLVSRYRGNQIHSPILRYRLLSSSEINK